VPEYPVTAIAWIRDAFERKYGAVGPLRFGHHCDKTPSGAGWSKGLKRIFGAAMIVACASFDGAKICAQADGGEI
jgi:hypothetical protein